MIEYLGPIVCVVGGFALGLVTGLMLARRAMERAARELLDSMDAARPIPLHRGRSTGNTYIPPDPSGSPGGRGMN